MVLRLYQIWPANNVFLFRGRVFGEYTPSRVFSFGSRPLVLPCSALAGFLRRDGIMILMAWLLIVLMPVAFCYFCVPVLWARSKASMALALPWYLVAVYLYARGGLVDPGVILRSPIEARLLAAMSPDEVAAYRAKKAEALRVKQNDILTQSYLGRRVQTIARLAESPRELERAETSSVRQARLETRFPTGRWCFTCLVRPSSIVVLPFVSLEICPRLAACDLVLFC